LEDEITTASRNSRNGAAKISDAKKIVAKKRIRSREPVRAIVHLSNRGERNVNTQQFTPWDRTLNNWQI